MQGYWMTDIVFPYLQIPGPRNFTSGGFLNIQSYAADGFSLFQTLVDRHYTAIVAGDDQISNHYELWTQMYPYPPFIQDSGLSTLYGFSLPTFVMLSLVLLSPTLIKSIVHEKETGVRELIRLMGMDGWLLWLGWFCHSFLAIILITAIMVFFLKISVWAPAANALMPPILIYTDWFLLWVILLLYGISSIAFCFAISCFFNRPTLATTIGILFWVLSYFIPRGMMDSQYDYLGLAPKLLSCLLPNMAINWAFRVISMFEGKAIGMQWTNLWETGNPRDELTMGMVMIMLVVDSVIYFLITWYVDKVLPGQYGVPYRWNFFLKPSYWKHSKSQPPPSLSTETLSEEEAHNHEPEPAGLKPGISIRHLRKTFPALGGGTKVAVDDVSFKCFEGECTVLLGHNGAGKTTTMSVITGIYPATGGTAEICGYNIHTHLEDARAQIGLCPQHNTLFADLSVEEHLLFFARLKGKSSQEAKKEAKELLVALQLNEKKTQFGNQLSGGMKRKLCLCIALVGGSKVIILDEPSSGLDPESRRWVWDMVQKERTSRTVLVTTHHMEEADVLGDRIAIMAVGKVVSSGSTIFLKKRFGDGYGLRVIPMKGCQIPLLTSAVKSIVPESSLSSASDEEVVFSLGEDKSRFAVLLEELTIKKDLLKIYHVGLSQTSMEQVFLRVGQEFDTTPTPERESPKGGSPKEGTPNGVAKGSDLHQNGSTATLNHATDNDTEHLFNSQVDVSTRLEGVALKFERVKALWMKRIIYSKRKIVLVLTQGLLPLLATLLCIVVDLMYFGNDYTQPSIDLSLAMFSDTTMSFVQASDGQEMQDLGNAYLDQFYGIYKAEFTDNLTGTLIAAGIADEYVYRESYITSAQFAPSPNLSKVAHKMMYQSIPIHAPGVGVNLISNAILQANTNSSYSISTANNPLPYDPRFRLDEDNTSGSSVTYALTMPFALSFLSSSFLVFPLQERVSKAKQIQVMTGTSSFALWFTSFTWDLVTYNISAVLVFILFMAIDPHNNFTPPGGPGALYFLLFMYGWCAIPMSYLFSFAFSTAASGFGILTLINMVTGMVIPVAVYGLRASEQPSLVSLSDVIDGVASLIPSYPISLGFESFLEVSTYNTQCDIIASEYVDPLCQGLTMGLLSSGQNSPFFACCSQCPLVASLSSYNITDVSNALTQFNITVPLPDDPGWWDNVLANAAVFNGTCFEEATYFQWDSPGLGRSFAWMVGDGFIFLFLIFLIEIGFGDIVRTWYYKLKQACCRRPKIAVYQVPADEDVLAEAKHAKKLMAGDCNPEGTALVVDGLTKEFRQVGLTAVDNIGFTVRKGECFGLLGVNGAGKTTTFRMLTGDEVPSGGDARIGGQFLSGGVRHFVREIGYCPQFDALLSELTGEETLNLLAGLRGVPRRQRKKMMKDFVELVDLTECYKRQTGTYSGGNKRKLSTAMALVGSPALVFLDEPTTGVDPASRRRVWMAIKSARANGQSIILTSHSMDECEALCNRIVILVRGQLRCAGSTGHLKAKFSQGHSLQIKLSPDTPSSHSAVDAERAFQDSVSRLQQYIDTELPGARLTDQHRGMLSYLIPPHISWSKLFSVMEALKDDTSGGVAPIEDYSATEPSLEQVFLAFAREADLGRPILEDAKNTVEAVTIL